MGFLEDAAREFRAKTVDLSPSLAKTLAKANSAVVLSAYQRDPLYPPFETFAQYLRAQRVLRQRYTQADYQRAAQTATAAANALEAQTGAVIARVWEESRFDTAAQNALASGFSLAAAGAAAGSVVPGVGTIIGAIGGFVVGVISAILPLGKQKALDDFRSVIKALKPVERYMVLGSLRQWSDDARRKMSLPVFAPWRIGDEGGILKLHTIGQGEDVLVLFFLEALLEAGCFLADPAPQASLYAVALVAAYTDDETKVKDMPFTSRLITTGVGGSWLQLQLRGAAEDKAKTVRERAIAAGLPDYGERLITATVIDEMRKAGYPT